MTDLKRLEVKYVRDRAKSRYERGDSCEMCGSTEKVQFHHYHTVDLLWNKWKKANGIIITDVDDILAVRDDFIADHEYELYSAVVTLCFECHNNKLHSVYGQKPLLSTAPKQARWVRKQAIKNGII